MRHQLLCIQHKQVFEGERVISVSMIIIFLQNHYCSENMTGQSFRRFLTMNVDILTIIYKHINKLNTISIHLI